MAIIFAPTSEIIEYLVNRNNYNSIINLLHRTDRLLHTYNNYIQYIVVIIIRDWVKIERLKGPVWLARWQGNRLWPNLHVTRPQLFSPLIFSSRSDRFLLPLRDGSTFYSFGSVRRAESNPAYFADLHYYSCARSSGESKLVRLRRAKNPIRSRPFACSSCLRLNVQGLRRTWS